MMVALVFFAYGLEQLSTAEKSAEQASSVPVASLSVSQVNQSRTQPRLKNGDIVFKAENSLIADIAAPLNADVNYSHAGIVVVEGDELNVVYGVLDGTLKNRVIKESLTDYLQPKDTAQAAVYRLKNSNTKLQRELATTAHRLAIGEDPADAALSASTRAAEPENNSNRLLSFTTAERMSCSAFVLKVYEQVGVGLEAQSNDSFMLPFARACPSPTELSNSEQLEPIYRFEPQSVVHSAYPSTFGPR